MKLLTKKIIAIIVLQSHNSFAQNFDTEYFNALHWRCIGPYRGGKTVGAVGVPSQPNVFYIGVKNGGVWKTNDFGKTWKPIFADQSTVSIGDKGLSLQHDLSLMCYKNMKKCITAMKATDGAGDENAELRKELYTGFTTLQHTENFTGQRYVADYPDHCSKRS